MKIEALGELGSGGVIPFPLCTDTKTRCHLRNTPLSSRCAMSEPPQLFLECIQANPDIAGIGVRVAIYAQNFIALLLGVFALGDRYVSWKEMLLIESQSMTILLTACALLLSAVIQAATFGMSTYHTLIVLNLAWMNNTNTLLYTVFFRYQGQVKIPGFKLSFSPRTDQPLPKKRAIPLLAVGTLHLSFVAGLGMWFWLKVDTFGARSQCASQLPLHLIILGHRVPIASKALRTISLVIYGITATPGLNVVVVVGVVYGIAVLCSWVVEKVLSVPRNVAFFLPGYITLALLTGVNVAIAIDTEVMINESKKFVQAGESEWTFGQTLAIFMLILPLKDIALAFLGDDKQFSQTRERIDEERAVYRHNWKKWMPFIAKVDWPNLSRPNIPPILRAPRATYRSPSSSSSSSADYYGHSWSQPSRRVLDPLTTPPAQYRPAPLPVYTRTIPHQQSLHHPEFRVAPSAIYPIPESNVYPTRLPPRTPHKPATVLMPQFSLV
ncbi:hypothetical protein AN958_12560 [Leucoagaricus sp. SymC.cos]|nr:hypothetical protein AN958_12560 [Leucoagaricus sp. SymC.cos]